MSALDHFGLALALAALAGLNVYLTAFLVALAARLEWFGAAELTGLDALANPAVMGGALVLFLIEFVVDKIPRADSLWDLAHTVVRPVGGAMVAMVSLAPGTGTFWTVAVAATGAAVAALMHFTKASIRLRLNATREPFSNVGASLAEDALVVAGFSLTVESLGLAVWVFGAIVALCALLAPKLWRSSRAILTRVWGRLRDRQLHGAENQAVVEAADPL